MKKRRRKNGWGTDDLEVWRLKAELCPPALNPLSIAVEQDWSRADLLHLPRADLMPRQLYRKRRRNGLSAKSGIDSGFHTVTDLL